MRRRIPVLTSATLITALVVTAVGAATAGVASAHGDSAETQGRAKNVISLLGDGMGRPHVTAARERYYGTDGQLAMESLPSQGFIST